jgi:ATPase subunit of ABC transporter with duplicated ATPase domains
MLGLVNLGKSFGSRTLFEGVSLQLNAGSRYGLVGANGAGKTTLLKILAGDEPASDGVVNIAARTRMSVLRQDRFLDDEGIILAQTMMGDEVVWSAMQALEAEQHKETPDAALLVELEDTIRANEGYTLEARASSVLEGLGVPREKHKEPLRTLSGGFKLRVLLAQVLIGGPDLLLLDEPTNHLDILSIRWLERFLANYTGCALVISHDVRFLDTISSHILDVDYGTVTLYTGNYSAFEREKVATRERKEAEIARVEKIIAEKRAFVDRFGAKATKASQAQSRMKQIQKLEENELSELQSSSRRSPHFRFTQGRPSGKEVLEVKDVSKSFGENHVLANVTLSIRRGEKIGIIGPNGLGKSTLLKILMNRLAPDGGTSKWGHETHVSYFAQEHKDLLTDEKMTPLEFVWAVDPKAATSHVRGQLGLVLFSGNDVEKPVGRLSGGECARLIFCRIMAETPNVLVLDEPTNHLDIEAIRALADSLAKYEGTVIFVSHDRDFVSRLATRIIELVRPAQTPVNQRGAQVHGLRDFPGTYAEYLERSGDDHLDANTVSLKAKAEKAELGKDAKRNTDSVLSWEEEKKKKNRKKALPGLRDKALEALAKAEARKKDIHELYASPGFFEKTAKPELDALKTEEQTLDARIDGLMQEWEALENEIAQENA